MQPQEKYIRKKPVTTALKIAIVKGPRRAIAHVARTLPFNRDDDVRRGAWKDVYGECIISLAQAACDREHHQTPQKSVPLLIDWDPNKSVSNRLETVW